MRNAMLGLALLGVVAAGAAAHAETPYAESPHDGRATIQPVYWSGDYCGPRCQAYRWRRHERWETRREWRHHQRWEERHYGYYAYPRY